MKKIGGFKHFYIVVIIFMLVICTIGFTYAYLTFNVRSNNDVSTFSSGYDVSMRITPIYNDFPLIPMDNSDVMKGINNQCKDKFNRGACHLYNIHVYDFDSSVSAISGTINTKLNNIVNLSYMVLESVSYDISNDNNCLSVSNKNYCIGKSSELIIENVDMSLGDNYSVFGLDDKDLLLVIWLTNLDESQNSYDVGDFNSLITIYLGGNGGEISGSIGGTLNFDGRLQSEGE